MTDEQTAGVIQNVPLLDLSHATTPEDVEKLLRVRNVGAVVVPANLSHALAGVPMQNVGAIIPVAAGSHLRVHTGSVQLGGDALANPGGDNEILVVTGTLIITSPVSRVGYREVIVTGAVVAPEGSEDALGAGLTRVTGWVNYYRYAEGQQIKSLTGDTKLSGESLANTGGSPDDVLLLTGQAIVTSPVRKAGYQRIFYTGELLVPRESESVLAPVLAGSGQVAWYGGRPRFFIGDESFGRAFFELLDEPLALALIGTMRLEDDVPPGLLRANVSEITLVGRLTAPKELIPVLQLLTTEKYGELAVAEGGSAG